MDGHSSAGSFVVPATPLGIRVTRKSSGEPWQSHTHTGRDSLLVVCEIVAPGIKRPLSSVNEWRPLRILDPDVQRWA